MRAPSSTFAALAVALGLALLRAAGARAADASAAAATPDAGVPPTPTDQLAREYRRLRKVRGHLSGGAGVWVDEVDSAGGRKEVVMGELGRRLAAGVTKARLVALMGAPDRVVHPGDPEWQARASARDGGAPIREVLVYYWRGEHDYLLFDLDGDRTAGSRWYSAYE